MRTGLLVLFVGLCFVISTLQKNYVLRVCKNYSDAPIV